MSTPIILVGMMGAGKSEIGKRLAGCLRRPFLDSDTQIELQAKKTIPELFASEGEARFRRYEAAVIPALFKTPVSRAPSARRCAFVLALGGGAFENPATRSFLLRRACCVWLDAPASVLARRLGPGGPGRPLAAGRTRTRLLVRMHQLKQARKKNYQKARFRIESGGRSPDKSVELVLRLFLAGGR